jgi:peptide chain release factor 1
MNSNNILERLEGVRLRFEEVEQLLTDPSVANDMQRYIKLNKEYRDLEPLIRTLR